MQTIAKQLGAGDPHVTELADAFVLESGTVLQGVRVTWHSWGRLNNARDNAVVVNHALTGSADVETWWPGLLGPGRALDPERDYIVCANVLGSCYGTTGPATIEAATGRPYGSRFPTITVRDMVRLQKRLIDDIGIRSMACVIGGSLGGMLTLEWALLYPDVVRSIVAVAAAASQPAWAIGWSEAQRQAIYADPDWRGGDYSQERPPRAGLAAARAMAMLSYRHWGEFQSRFGRRRRADGVYEAQSYLRHHGETFIDRFQASSYVTLTRAMDTFDVGAGRGGCPKALAGIRVPVLLASVDSDLLYPVDEQAFLARHIPAAEHVVLRSPHGHDGFLIETDSLNAFVRDFRERLGKTVKEEVA